MRSRPLFVFGVTFVISFSVFTLFGLLAGGTFAIWPEMTGYFLAVAVVSAALGAAGALSAALTGKESEEVASFGTEMAEEAGNYAQAFKLLGTGPFRVIATSFILITLGLVALGFGFRDGARLFLFGQTSWFFARVRLAQLLDSGSAGKLEDHVRWIMRGLTLYSLVATFALIGSLDGVEITGTTTALALPALLAIIGSTMWYRANKEPFGGAFVIATMVFYGWVTIAVLVVNHTRDITEPVLLRSVTFRECPKVSNENFNNADEKIEQPDFQRFADCKYFAGVTNPELGDRIETSDHLGIAGITWRGRVLRRARER